jgi:hypothetical protein
MARRMYNDLHSDPDQNRVSVDEYASLCLQDLALESLCPNQKDYRADD